MGTYGLVAIGDDLAANGDLVGPGGEDRAVGDTRDHKREAVSEATDSTHFREPEPGTGAAVDVEDHVDGPTVERAAMPGDEGVAGEGRFCAFRAAVHLSPGASQMVRGVRDGPVVHAHHEHFLCSLLRVPLAPRGCRVPGRVVQEELGSVSVHCPLLCWGQVTPSPPPSQRRHNFRRAILP